MTYFESKMDDFGPKAASELHFDSKWRHFCLFSDIFWYKNYLEVQFKTFFFEFFLLNGFRRNIFCLFFDSSSISAVFRGLFWPIFFLSRDLYDDLWLWDHSLLTEREKKGTKEKMTKRGALGSLITLYVTNISNIYSDKYKIRKDESRVIKTISSYCLFHMVPRCV